MKQCHDFNTSLAVFLQFIRPIDSSIKLSNTYEIVGIQVSFLERNYAFWTKNGPNDHKQQVACNDEEGACLSFLRKHHLYHFKPRKLHNHQRMFRSPTIISRNARYSSYWSNSTEDRIHKQKIYLKDYIDVCTIGSRIQLEGYSMTTVDIYLSIFVMFIAKWIWMIERKVCIWSHQIKSVYLL